ncbi:transposable element Tcb2 transposase [Trichonephila clavipes]|nr:transposable element Tcb2 transposase [Trichonephila clavipes]
MDWQAYSPDLNPIEHVRDALGRRNAARLHHPENTQLKQMLIEELALLPQEMLLQLVLSMSRRCEATVACSDYLETIPKSARSPQSNRKGGTMYIFESDK